MFGSWESRKLAWGYVICGPTGLLLILSSDSRTTAVVGLGLVLVGLAFTVADTVIKWRKRYSRRDPRPRSS